MIEKLSYHFPAGAHNPSFLSQSSQDISHKQTKETLPTY